MNEVIEWLHSPDGEQWSRKFVNPNGGPSTYQPAGNTYPGFFSIKGDEEGFPVGYGYSGPMNWGLMPGDDKLYKEAIDAGIDLP